MQRFSGTYSNCVLEKVKTTSEAGSERYRILFGVLAPKNSLPFPTGITNIPTMSSATPTHVCSHTEKESQPQIEESHRSALPQARKDLHVANAPR